MNLSVKPTMQFEVLAANVSWSYIQINEIEIDYKPVTGMMLHYFSGLSEMRLHADLAQPRKWFTRHFSLYKGGVWVGD